MFKWFKNKITKDKVKCSKEEVPITIDSFTDFPGNYSIDDKLESKIDRRVYIVTYKQNKYILKMKQQIFENELKTHNILSQIAHFNLQRVWFTYRTLGYDCFVYEYVEGIDMFDYYEKYKEIGEEDIRSIIKQTALGLQFLHKHGIIHGDIKHENVIFNPVTKIAKIIDFDLCVFMDTNKKYISNQLFGTNNHIAPESKLLGEYSRKTDVWQLGVLLYMLITDKYPCSDNYVHICDINCERKMKKRLLNDIIERKFNVTVYDLVNKMICLEEYRYTIDDVLQSEWLNQ